jgi:hypothetical protein
MSKYLFGFLFNHKEKNDVMAYAFKKEREKYVNK